MRYAGAVRVRCALVFLAGCSIFTDLSDLRDAATETSVPDVFVDGGSSDGCGHTFCDNFDDHAPGTGWDDVIPANVSLSDVAQSPPSALQALTNAAGSGPD